LAAQHGLRDTLFRYSSIFGKNRKTLWSIARFAAESTKTSARACTSINELKDFGRCSRFVFQELSKASGEKQIERDWPLVWWKCKNPAETAKMFAT
jgi:hypothetical protein